MKGVWSVRRVPPTDGRRSGRQEGAPGRQPWHLSALCMHFAAVPLRLMHRLPSGISFHRLQRCLK